MMKCYRIYTEDINKGTILFEASQLLPKGFTIINGMGYWRGVQEPCLIIEVTGLELLRQSIKQLAANIKRLNCQEAVLITETDISFLEFV